MLQQLTFIEIHQLSECEAVIERGLQTFVEVGNALMKIRDERLYRGQYGTFEDYCRERWGIEKRHAYRLIDAASVVKNVSHGTHSPPVNERQARPLARLAPDQQPVAWQQVIETAPHGANGQPKITARHVEQVVETFIQPQPARPDFDYKRDMKANRQGDIYEPKGYDLCQTPAYALDPLLPYLPDSGVVWEPACGENLLVDGLYDAGRQVVATDIQIGVNFFEWEPEAWSLLVTNPPYSVKYQWLERCYQLGKPFALLMPVEMLGAKTAQDLFRQYGVEIILLDRRVNFKMPNKGWQGGGAQFPVAWYTWGLCIGQQLTFEKLEYTDG